MQKLICLELLLAVVYFIFNLYGAFRSLAAVFILFTLFVIPCVDGGAEMALSLC